MTNLFPGAEWRPMPGQEKRPARRKGRGVGFHVAVYTGPSIYDINLRTGNDAHLYVRLDGSLEQNVDLDLQAWAGVDGNPSMIWVETAGGVDPKTVNTEPWTPPQAATLARIARWAHDTEGTPLQVMPDSKPASRGIGTHRLGITHSRGIGTVPGFRVAGGESWSTHVGKECPGDAKVAQVSSIVAAAGPVVPQEDDDMSTVKIIGIKDAKLGGYWALNLATFQAMHLSGPQLALYRGEGVPIIHEDQGPDMLAGFEIVQPAAS